MDELGGAQADGTTGHRGPGRPGSPVDAFRLKRALLNGKVWLIGAAIGGLVLGLLVAKLGMVSPYETTAVLRYEGDLDVYGLPPSNDSIAPAADALRRQSVLTAIREEVGFEGGLTQLGAAIDYQVNLLAGTMQITVLGETGEQAAEFAKVVTDVFTTYHKERQARRIEQEIARLIKRIEAADTEANAARRRYNVFREEHGIANLSTEQQSMVQSAAKLRADAELASSEVRALEAQVSSLETQLAATPKTNFVSGGSSPERAAYNRMREELASARATLSNDHPRVQSLEQQVARLKVELSKGGSSGGNGLVSANATYGALQGQLRDTKSRLAALRERQKGLSAMADKAQTRIETFSDIEGEASTLLADVKVNENLVTSLRHTEAGLEDALRDPPSGFVVLDPGAIPEFPIRNKMKMVVFVAIPMLAIGLALVLVLRREFRGFRVGTPAEIAFWGNGPALGATHWPDDPSGLDELVAGLDDFAPDARGTLLFVGGSPNDARLALELAERMNQDWFLAGAAAAPGAAPSVAPEETTPLKTPPPSGPYPIGGNGTQSTALARRPSVPALQPVRLLDRARRLELDAWNGPFEGQALRRAARLADRVVVLVRSGQMSVIQLRDVQQRLGRQAGIGYIVVGLSNEYRTLPDRAGKVTAFWAS